jgi:type 1 fimbria pilin
MQPMNINRSSFLYLAIILLFLTSALLSKNVAAETNQCYRSSSKDANAWSYDFGSIIMSATDNTAGMIKNDVTSFNMKGSAALWCDCTESSRLYFSSSMNIPDDGDGWFKLNDYLDIKLNINFNGTYRNIPFQDASTGSASGAYCQKQNIIGGTPTGGSGKLSLKITHPFVGQTFIPSQVIAQECITSGVTGVNCTQANAAYVYSFSGSVTVPQNCTINSGTQVVVNFGSLYSSDFTTAGEKPKNFTPQTFNVPIQCNDISASANLTIRLEGTQSTGFNDAIQSDNKDVGVVVQDQAGNTLTPNARNSVVPFTLDGNGYSDVTLTAYPISITGLPPSEGVFTALAYLIVDFS